MSKLISVDAVSQLTGGPKLNITVDSWLSDLELGASALSIVTTTDNILQMPPVTLDTSFEKFFSKFGRLSGHPFRQKFRKILVEIWGASEFYFISRNLPLLHWRSDQVQGATMLNYNKRTIG